MSGNQGGQARRGGRNQGNQQKKNGTKRKSRNRSRAKKVDPVKYWGDRDLLVLPESFKIESADTSIVATSLGRTPIPGQENASKHYFSLVYDRAAMLATALAAAGDIENMRANADLLAEELRAKAADSYEAELDDASDAAGESNDASDDDNASDEAGESDDATGDDDESAADDSDSEPAGD